MRTFRRFRDEKSDELPGRFGDTFSQLETFMATDSHVLVDVSNLKNGGNVTTLAWDIVDVLSSFPLRGRDRRRVGRSRTDGFTRQLRVRLRP